MLNKSLWLFIFFFTCLGIYGNDSLLVDKEWTERRTIYVNKEEIDSIGEDSLIENYGIACGYDGCKKMEFSSNHRFRMTYPYDRILNGKWNLKNDILTIVYDKKEKWGKKRYKFKIKYRKKIIKEKECPTLYLFATKGHVRACYIFCYYNEESLGQIQRKKYDDIIKCKT